MKVALTWTEAAEAARRGSHRRLRRLKSNAGHRWGYDGSDNWSAHIEAVGSEMALAKALDRYYGEGSDPDYDGDVADLQVRHTTREHGALILHPEDSDQQRFYLVIGEVPHFNIVGSLLGEEGKQEEFWRTDTGRPAFFVPQSRLEPFTRAVAA